MTIKADQVALGLLLSGDRQFVIPDYQRPYVWSAEHAALLVEDLLQAWQRGDTDCFLGSLVVVSQEGIDDVDVIDGQQRLTTLFMLLDRLGIDRAAKLTYASRRSATDALSRLSATDDDEGSGILTGYKAIDARVSRLSKSTEDLATFTRFLTQQVHLVRAVLPDGTDLNKYFEIIPKVEK